MDYQKSTLASGLFIAAGMAMAAGVGVPVARGFGKSWADVWPNGLGLFIAACLFAAAHLAIYKKSK